MATYCLSNFVKDPSISDSLMYIYNCSNVLMSMIDPYTTVFYYKGKYVNIVTDGKMNYNNVLDFSSESEAISAVARLNDVKKIFIDRINQAIQHGTENAWITGEGDAYFRNITGNTCFINNIELLSGSESQFIMKDSVNGNRYKIILSGGTFNIQPI
jgi:hypothetical protein